MNPHLTLEVFAFFAGAVLLLVALALFLFARLIVARRKARLWEQIYAPPAKAYTLERRWGRLRLKEVRL